MLTTAQLLEPLAARRTDEVVVTTMSTVRPWGRYSNHAFDFASADSAMGHTADLALGIAMAQPGRTVICLNGDGSLLMSLGTLVTIVESGVTNLVLIVVDNGAFELTGGQPVAGAGRVRYGEVARACGFRRAYSCRTPQEYASALDQAFGQAGPTLVEGHVEPGEEGPISRGPAEEAAYLQTSLYDSARALREALGSPPGRGQGGMPDTRQPGR
jgi:thiamine pyrophosphate-dependent acetolactate synthase large subunit-like protein